MGLDFALLWGFRLLLFGTYFAMLPTLPVHLQGLGMEPATIGLVIAAMPFGAILVRGWVGVWLDQWGRKGVLIGGTLLSSVAILGYTWAGGLVPFLLLRVVHSFGWAAAATGTDAVAADMAPPERRAEVMGYYGLAGDLAQILSTMLAWQLLLQFGAGVFLFMALTGGVAALAGLFIRVPGRPPEQARSRPAGVWETLSHAPTLVPCLSLLVIMLGFQGVERFLPLWAPDRGLLNPAYYYFTVGLATMLARPMGGRLSDRIGVRRLMPAFFGGVVVALLLLAWAPGPWVIIAAAVVGGLAYGSAKPSFLALALELAGPARRGRALAQWGVVHDLATAFGAAGLGMVLDVTGENWAAMHVIAAAPIAAAMVISWAALVRAGGGRPGRAGGPV